MDYIRVLRLLAVPSVGDPPREKVKLPEFFKNFEKKLDPGIVNYVINAYKNKSIAFETQAIFTQWVIRMATFTRGKKKCSIQLSNPPKPYLRVTEDGVAYYEFIYHSSIDTIPYFLFKNPHFYNFGYPVQLVLSKQIDKNYFDAERLAEHTNLMLTYAQKRSFINYYKLVNGDVGDILDLKHPVYRKLGWVVNDNDDEQIQEQPTNLLSMSDDDETYDDNNK